MNNINASKLVRRKKIGLRLLFLVAGLALAAGGAAGIIYLRDSIGITTINPARPPQPILETAELEKLTTLQNTQDVFLLSGVSLDDSTIIVAAGSSEESGPRQASWMNIQTGELEPITEEFLKLFPQSQVAWSSNQTVVYVSNNESGDPILVTLDRASGEIKSEALPVNGRLLSLAPNGSRVLVEAGSKDGMDLMMSNLETGESEKLLSYPNGGGLQSIAWTDDGSKLAFVRYTVPPELASDQAKINEMVMRDALGKLPLDQNPLFTGNVVDVFDLEQGGQNATTLHTAISDGYLFHKVVWSPDGQRLLTRMIRPSQPAGREHPVVVVGAFPDRAYYRVYDASLALTDILDRPEIETPLASHALFVSPDEALVIAAYGLNFHIYYFNLLSDEFHILPIGDGTFGESPNGYQVHATHQSRQLIYHQSSFQHPADIYRLDLDGTEPQALTQFNAQAAAVNQIRVDEVSFQLDEDTTRIGYLLQPADASFPPKNIPIVLYQQGGPGGAMTNRWGASAEEPFNLLPNFGFGVLFMPFSGREGFGPEFFRALADDENFGQLDIAESAQAVRYLIEHDYVQPGAVGIAGCSYGGYFAAQSITQYPDLYAAANVQCAVLDMIKWWEPNPFLVSFMEGSVPADQTDEYRNDSPYYSAAQVKTPLLLLHGMDDNLPFQIVRDFRNGIDEDTTPVKMLVFKNEGHTLSFSSSRLIAAQEQIVWFRKYLGIQQTQ
jgi:dipeptidyl aminopeptidase/acylaminoacyl peptidase